MMIKVSEIPKRHMFGFPTQGRLVIHTSDVEYELDIKLNALGGEISIDDGVENFSYVMDSYNSVDILSWWYDIVTRTETYEHHYHDVCSVKIKNRTIKVAHPKSGAMYFGYKDELPNADDFVSTWAVKNWPVLKILIELGATHPEGMFHGVDLAQVWQHRSILSTGILTLKDMAAGKKIPIPEELDLVL